MAQIWCNSGAHASPTVSPSPKGRHNLWQPSSDVQARTASTGRQVGARVLEGYPTEPTPGKTVIWDEASVRAAPGLHRRRLRGRGVAHPAPQGRPIPTRRNILRSQGLRETDIFSKRPVDGGVKAMIATEIQRLGSGLARPLRRATGDHVVRGPGQPQRDRSQIDSSAREHIDDLLRLSGACRSRASAVWSSWARAGFFTTERVRGHGRPPRRRR